MKLSHSQRRSLRGSRRAQLLGRRVLELRVAATDTVRAYQALAGGELTEELAAELLLGLMEADLAELVEEAERNGGV
jgi:hypothetical protein